MAKTLIAAILIALSPALACAAPQPESPAAAVVVNTVENMHRGPSAETDVVSQALLGDNVKVLKTEKNPAGEDWRRIATPDTYEGWVPASSLRLPRAGREALRRFRQGLRRLVASRQYLSRTRRHEAQTREGGPHRHRPRGRRGKGRALARSEPALQHAGLGPEGRRRRPRSALVLAAAPGRGHDRPGQALHRPALHLGRRLPARPRLLRFRPARLQDERHPDPAGRRHPDDRERPRRGPQGPGEARRPRLLRPRSRQHQPRRDHDRGRELHQRDDQRRADRPDRPARRGALDEDLPGRAPPEE